MLSIQELGATRQVRQEASARQTVVGPYTTLGNAPLQALVGTERRVYVEKLTEV